MNESPAAIPSLTWSGPGPFAPQSRWMVLGSLVALVCAVTACQPSPPAQAEADAAEPAVEEVASTVEDVSVDEDILSGYTEPEAPSVEPGVGLRRLDRLAYNNTVRDLFGIDSRPADAFPPDPESHGFDNLSDHLSISQLLMEYYAQAVESLAAAALLPSTEIPFGVSVEAETLEAPDESFPVAGIGVGVYTLYPLEATFEVPEAADYVFEVLAWREKIYWTGNTAPRLAVLLNTETVQEFTVTGDASSPETLAVTHALEPGSHTFAVRVLNPQFDVDEDQGFSGVVVTVDWFRLSSPDVLLAQPSARDELLLCDPADSSTTECGESILSTFVRRAWRRPPTDAEVTRLLEFVTDAVDEGEGFEVGIRTAIEAALMSPHFLFLVENGDEGEVSLTDHQMATRLSYFLWSSMPDEALLAAADAGEVHTTEQIRAQAQRMLDDPKAQSLFDNVADQWLLARKVESIQPNPVVFTSFDNALRDSMAEEVRQFFRSFVNADRTIFDLVTSTDLFVDDVMAQHYGLDPVGPDFVHLETHTAPRGGVLRQAGILSANSHPYRTSPTRRGQWVLEKLLCTDIGAPPPGQALFFDPTRLDDELTETPKLLQHFTDPVCAACHVVMDPLGLAMENYDAIGRWRSNDHVAFDELETVFDPDAILYTTEEVIELVANDPNFPRCVVQQLTTYALGRTPLPSDEVVIDGLTEALPSIDYSLRELLVLIATSQPFRERLVYSEDAASERPSADEEGP